jgi:V/A-type H+-transporting ATPase subunit A
MDHKEGIVQLINGPVVKGINMGAFKLNEMVTVGNNRLIGEVVSIDGDVATVQVYEETEGLKAGERILYTGSPLSVTLGLGMLGNIFDGIQRPLQRINSMSSDYIPEGIGLLTLDEEKRWPAQITVKPGDELTPGMVYATVQETQSIVHKLIVPANISGKVIEAVPDGDYTINDTVVVLEKANKGRVELKLSSKWPVRQPRPVARRIPIYKPLVTGQRVIDSFIRRQGGMSECPADWHRQDSYSASAGKMERCRHNHICRCGERGNEMTDVLEDSLPLWTPGPEGR